MHGIQPNIGKFRENESHATNKIPKPTFIFKMETAFLESLNMLQTRKRVLISEYYIGPNYTQWPVEG